MEIDKKEQRRQVGIEQAKMFEEALKTLEQVQIETSHLIHGKMYARTIFIPAGTALTGVLTKLDNICIVLGDISVTTDDGVVRLTGYNILPATKGYKRVGYAHSDSYWTTLIPTEKTTVEEIENEMSDESHLLQSRQITQIEGSVETET
jgi:hypothetical protein